MSTIRLEAGRTAAAVKHANGLWDFGNPKSDARWLLLAREHSGEDIDKMRELIQVLEADRRGLEFLVHHGIVDGEHLEAVFKFRAEVLHAFDELAAEAEAPEETNVTPSEIPAATVPIVAVTVS